MEKNISASSENLGVVEKFLFFMTYPARRALSSYLSINTFITIVFEISFKFSQKFLVKAQLKKFPHRQS